MAIRDFGNSLLADVRKRSDEKRDDARRYARKQSNRDVLRGLGSMIVAPIVGGAIQGVGEIFTSSLQNKTNKFLADSDLYNNKVIVARGGTAIADTATRFDAAEERGISIDDYELEILADNAVANKEVLKANSVRAGTEKEFKSLYMQRDNIKALAKEQADYHRKIRSLTDEYNTGKAKNTLDAISKLARPKTPVGAIWNKFVDNDTSIDAFNAKMQLLGQVKVANEIEALTLQSRANTAQRILDAGGDTSVANLLVGDMLSEEETAELKKMQEDGKSFVDSSPALSITANGGIISSVIRSTTLTNKNVETSRKDTVIKTPEQLLTTKDVEVALGRLPTLYAMIEKRFNKQGQEEFEAHIKELSKGKKMSMKLINSFWLASVNTDWASEGTGGTKLDPRIQAALIDGNTEALASVMEVVSLNLGKPDEESKRKVVAGMNIYIDFQNRILDAVESRKSELAPKTNKPKEGDLAKDPNTSQPMQYQKDPTTGVLAWKYLK